jgi:hypothetical protein
MNIGEFGSSGSSIATLFSVANFFRLRNYQSRLILFPFPILVNYVHELKRLIMVNGQDETKLISYINTLKTIPFSVELTKETDIAYGINSLAKHSKSAVVSSAARELTKKWKRIYETLQSKNQNTTTSSSSETLPTPTPTPMKNINVDSPQIKTWRVLFHYCEEETTNIFHHASSKASQVASDLKNGKRSTCSSMTVQQETDEKKKRRIQARLTELKLPTKKKRSSSLSDEMNPISKVKMTPIVPLHEQKIPK